MSNKSGTYFLGRLTKMGTLDTEKFIEVLMNSPRVSTREYHWLITDSFYDNGGEFDFFFGKLSKYAPLGETKVIDVEKKETKNDSTNNLAISSSPFIYIPEFSGICYLRIWNQIDVLTFKSRLQDIVREYYQSFFVDLHINDIVEGQVFEKRIKEFSKIHSINCTIHQPNPLYGDIWKHLRDYLIHRNSKEMKIIEESKNEEGIQSDLLLKKNEGSKSSLSIVDAAICMALDGYGSGKVTGIINGKEKTIDTGENILTIKAAKEPDPLELALQAYSAFKKVNDDRKLGH